MEQQRTYSISDLSREFGITTRTIRYYEDQGLIRPERKGRQRIYSRRDRTRLKLILRGKRLGFPLKEIGEIIDMYNGERGEARQLRHMCARIRDDRAMLLRRRDEIDAVLREMDAIESQCLNSLAEHGE